MCALFYVRFTAVTTTGEATNDDDDDDDHSPSPSPNKLGLLMLMAGTTSKANIVRDRWPTVSSSASIDGGRMLKHRSMSGQRAGREHSPLRG